MTFALINKLTAKPGQRGRVIEILLTSGRLQDDNPAKLQYMVTEAVNDPDVIWVIDQWTSKDAHEAAMKNPALRPYIHEAMPLLMGIPEQTELTPRN